MPRQDSHKTDIFYIVQRRKRRWIRWIPLKQHWFYRLVTRGLHRVYLKKKKKGREKENKKYIFLKKVLMHKIQTWYLWLSARANCLRHYVHDLAFMKILDVSDYTSRPIITRLKGMACDVENIFETLSVLFEISKRLSSYNFSIIWELVQYW